MPRSKPGGRKLPVRVIVALLSAGLLFALLAIPLANTATAGSQTNLASLGGHPLVHLEQENSTVASALDAALNSHDSNAALALFSDSAVISDLSNIACLPGPPPLCGGYNVYTSRTQIEGWLQQLVQENIAVKEIGSFNVKGDNVTWTLEVSVNEYRRLNVAPLTATAQALIHNGKIDSLTIMLTEESTTKLTLGYSSTERTPYAILALGISLGILSLGLVFPAAAMYYISRVERLFQTVPGLRKPWVLLQVGVLSLFIAILLIGVGSIRGPTPSLNTIQYVIVVFTGFFIFLSMLWMRQVWSTAPGD